MADLLAQYLRRKKSFIPYLTFGDPTIADSVDRLLAAVYAGADVLEIGVPFSDPIADGPVIQASHQRALSQEKKPTLSALFSVLQTDLSFEKRNGCPVVLMVSVNLVLHYGISLFFSDAAQAGVSGVILPDLSIDNADAYLSEARSNKIALIFLISTLCTPVRLQKIVKKASGFVYLISSTGLTGTRDTLDFLPMRAITDRIRAIRDIPVVVGFGIKTPDQARQVWTFADGVILGSHLVHVAHTGGLTALGDEINRFLSSRPQ